VQALGFASGGAGTRCAREVQALIASGGAGARYAREVQALTSFARCGGRLRLAIYWRYV